MAQIDCKTSGCKRKGYWTEIGPDGEVSFCFRTRHDGTNHAVKLTQAEIQEIYESVEIPRVRAATA